MSLDYDLTRLDPVKRAEFFPPDANDLMNDELHVLIWLTIPVGIGDLTEANAEDFWIRADLWQKSIGSGWNRVVGDDLVPIYVTREQVFAAVGLHTNVSSKTDSVFLKDLYAAKSRMSS